MVDVKIPQWAQNFFTEQAFERVEQAIQKAESKTSAEIVPLVVKQSMSTGHIVPLVFILTYFFAHVLLNEVIFPEDDSILTMIGPLGFSIVATYLLKSIGFIQRLLTAPSDMDAQVERRALMEFYQSHFHQTENATGILIFVSVLERRVFVLADKAINEKVSADVWKDVISILVKDFKSGEMGLGFAKAIEKCGEIVTPQFPIQTDDKNELHDHLVFKD